MVVKSSQKQGKFSYLHPDLKQVRIFQNKIKMVCYIEIHVESLEIMCRSAGLLCNHHLPRPKIIHALSQLGIDC